MSLRILCDGQIVDIDLNNSTFDTCGFPNVQSMVTAAVIATRQRE